MIETTTEPAVRELAAIGRFAAERGWVPATSGNFSRRISPTRILVTRSGVDKGALRDEDFCVVLLAEPLPEGVSAETPLHVARYRSNPAIGAVLHVHTVAATVLSRADQKRGEVVLDGFEMHKAIAGFTTHESTVRLPVFANAQDTVQLAQEIETALGSSPAVPGYLLAGHGLYAWGDDMPAAQRHLEGLEFLLRCELEERRIRTA